MYDHAHEFPEKLRWLCFGIFVVLLILVTFSLLLPASETSANADSSTESSEDTMIMYDGPNAVTAGLTMAADEFGQTVDSVDRGINRSAQNAATTASASGKFVATGLHSGTVAAGHGVHNSALFMGRTVNNTGIFMARAMYMSMAVIFYVPSHILNYAGDTAVVSAVIKPAGNTTAPKIDPTLPGTMTGKTALSTEALITKPVSQVVPAASVSDSEAMWPIHGEITTEFGVPHWPYQPTHTGLDISDGARSGVTPVKPYKAGRVVEVVHSYVSLGNHVVIDHGNGITSVYGHMYSTNVQVGQQVDHTTTLGTEGSTGASTGTHLHFEIRLNGQAVSPWLYIVGRP